MITYVCLDRFLVGSSVYMQNGWLWCVDATDVCLELVLWKRACTWRMVAFDAC